MLEKLKNRDWNILNHGDKVIWSMVALLLAVSLLGVFSTSTIREVNSITSVFLSYARDIAVGIVIMYLAYITPYKVYRGIAVLSVYVSIGLLVWASFNGMVIAGQNAGRWIRIFGFSFQPSSVALVSMVMYVAYYLEKYQKNKEEMGALKIAFLKLWLPMMTMFGLIVVHNLSTGIIFLVTFYAMLLMGFYSWKHILASFMVFIVIALSVHVAYLNYPKIFDKTRVPTWESRIDSFFQKDKEVKEMTVKEMDKIRQVIASKTAVALGVTDPAGPGKSKQKYFLSQADSDFIYAIIVEENGLLGGLLVLLCFVTIVIRVTLQVFKSMDMFSMLTLSGLLCVMMSQAIVHMGVVVGMIPVTGQNLPFISSGGTSILASLLIVGIMQKIISHRQFLTSALKAQMEDTSVDQKENVEDEQYANEVLEEIQNK